MESNGVKNRIQVSQSTADELTKRGKGSWLIPREDKVAAKGKCQVSWSDFSGLLEDLSNVFYGSHMHRKRRYADILHIDEATQEHYAIVDKQR